ncbi:hypothetical protein AAMO2058_001145800 [Amorphochlora amoebiformis]
MNFKHTNVLPENLNVTNTAWNQDSVQQYQKNTSTSTLSLTGNERAAGPPQCGFTQGSFYFRENQASIVSSKVEAKVQVCDEYKRRPELVIWQSQTGSSIHGSHVTKAPQGSKAQMKRILDDVYGLNEKLNSNSTPTNTTHLSLSAKQGQLALENQPQPSFMSGSRTVQTTESFQSLRANAGGHSRVKRLKLSFSKTEQKASHGRSEQMKSNGQSLGKREQKTSRVNKKCPLCKNKYKGGLPRHISECKGGIFWGVCKVVNSMFGNSRNKLNKSKIRMAFDKLIKDPMFKAELINRMANAMSKRTKSSITRERFVVWAPNDGDEGFTPLYGYDAVVYAFFSIFDYKIPVPLVEDTDDKSCVDLTGFDSEISDEVRQCIRMMKEKAGVNAGKDVLFTSQDSLDTMWWKIAAAAFNVVNEEIKYANYIGARTKHFNEQRLHVVPTEKFAWLKGFLVAYREFSVEALGFKTQPDGAVGYRRVWSTENVEVLSLMSTFMMHNYREFMESFRDIIESQNQATELRLQLLRAILVMPRRSSDLLPYLERLVEQISQHFETNFASHLGNLRVEDSDVPPMEDVCHFVHFRGSLASGMYANTSKGTFEPIVDGKGALGSSAHDLFLHRGLHSQAVPSCDTKSLHITATKGWNTLNKNASKFTALKSLLVVGCMIPGIGSFLFDYCAKRLSFSILRRLTIDFTFPLPDNEIVIIRQFEDLRHLHLVRNSITTLQPGVFDDLSNLKILSLAGNHLKGLPRDLLKGCENLREISLTFNQICELTPTAFVGLCKLEILRLPYNQLCSLDGGIFHGLISLKELRLSSNKLHRLEEGALKDLKSLEVFDVGNNHLKRLPVGIFHPLKMLRELDLSFNKLQLLDEGAFDDLKTLKVLDLGSNELKDLPVNVFRSLISLKELYLSGNQLQSLEIGMFHDLKSLEILHVSENRLQRLPVGVFEHLISLRELNLTENQLKSLDKETFNNLKSLEVLKLDKNQLKRLPVGVFQPLRSLGQLWLKDNPLPYNQIDLSTVKARNTQIFLYSQKRSAQTFGWERKKT